MVTEDTLWASQSVVSFNPHRDTPYCYYWHDFLMRQWKQEVPKGNEVLMVRKDEAQIGQEDARSAVISPTLPSLA